MSTTITKQSETADVLRYIQEHPLIIAESSRLEVIGAWTWVWFAARPSADCRDVLKSAGFHWNKARQCWQHTGGKRSRHTDAAVGYVREKYGSATIKEE
jgi:hypothetical protein